MSVLHLLGKMKYCNIIIEQKTDNNIVVEKHTVKNGNIYVPDL